MPKAKDGLKECIYCHKIKPIDQYYSDRYNPDGVQSHCKDCDGNPPKGLDLERLAEAFRTRTVREVATIYRRSHNTVRKWKKWQKRHDYDVGRESKSLIPQKTQKSIMPDFDEWPEIFADDFIVLSDVEIPYQDREIVDMVHALGNVLGIKYLILGGDFVAFDSISKWPQDVDIRPRFAEERDEMCRELINLHETFEHITYITGNHERRFVKKFEGHDDINSYIEAKVGIKVSPYSKCIVHSCRGDIMVCHQENYSKVPLSVPYELASNELCHIICGHTHRLALGWDRSGRFQIAESGYARDPMKTPYKQLHVTRHPKWNPGFVLVRNGKFTLVDPENCEDILGRAISQKYEPKDLVMLDQMKTWKGEAA